jgi:hypothetical protein
MGEHYILKLLEAKAAAQAEIITVHGKGPISASKARLIKSQISAISGQLADPNIRGQAQVGQAPAADQVAPEAATTAPTEKAAPRAPGRAGAVVGRRAIRPDPGTPPPVEGGDDLAAISTRPEQLTSEPRPEAPKAPAPEPTERALFLDPTEDEKSGLSRMETQREADVRVTAEAAAEVEAVQGRPVTPRALGMKAQVTKKVDKREFAAIMKSAGATPWVTKNGGWGRAEAASAGFYLPAFTRVDDALEDYVNGREIDNDGFQREVDARVFADAIPPPRRRLYASDELYKDAKKWYDYASKKFEVFEAPGIQNTIDAGGLSFRLKATSTARNQDAQGIKQYNVLAAKMQEGMTFVQKLRDQAKLVRRVGIGTGGWFNANEGMFSIPGLNSEEPGVALQANTVLRLAMQFIKTEDPTARLSDKDVEIGLRAMNAEGGAITTILDIVQSFNGVYDDNTVRVSMDRFLQKLAWATQKAYMQTAQNDLVLDYNSMKYTRDESNEAQRWLSVHRDFGE